MLLNRAFIGLALVFGSTPAWALSHSSATFENIFGFSSNPTLASDPSGDFYDRVSGVARFPIEKTLDRFSIRYSAYFQQITNNLLSIDWSTRWSNYELKVLDRDYVHQAPGTTDQSFSRVGVSGSTSWSGSDRSWKYTPQFEIDRYSSISRVDFMPAFEIEVSPDSGTSDRSFSAEVTPGLNLSTVSDFSKFYLSFSGSFVQILSESVDWGASIDLTLSEYLSRTSSSTVLTQGRGRNSGGTTTVNSSEATLLFTPDIYWAKQLARAWEFRAEVFANLQGSKSGTYSFQELELLASLRCRI